MSKNVILEDEAIRAEFDGATGALLRLQNKATGWAVQRRPEHAMSLRMLVPLPGRRNNPVLGQRQKLAALQVGPDSRSVTLVWKNLRSEFGGEHDIAFTARVTLSEAGLTFECTLENRSPHVVETVCYPCIGDLSRPEGAEGLEHQHIGYGGMARHALSPTFSNHRGYYGTDYPIQISATPEAPFALVTAPKEGLYVGCHDTSLAEMVQFVFELKPGYDNSFTSRVPEGERLGDQDVRIEFNVVHFPFAAAGETASLSPIQLTPYAGTWHKGADCYKRWRATWFRRPACPDWAAKVHSWQQIHINSPEDELRCRYSDLVQYGRDCAKHGVAAIQLVGWNDGGQDRGNPSHDHDPRLGTWQELRDAIAAIQALGVKLILFSKFTWADRSQEWFRRELVNYACTDPYGDYHVYGGYQYQTATQLADINTRRLIPMCQNSPAWREIANREFRKLIALGAAGMLYDECQHHGGARYCFHGGHGHRVPAHVFAGDPLLERGFHEIARREAPDFFFAGEACWDMQYRHYSLSYFRIGCGHVPLPRYVDPFQNLMVAVTGYNDRGMINQCLLCRYVISYEPLNFKGRLDDYPLTMEHGKKVDALRRRYSAYLWDGEFRDTQHAKVTVGGKDHGPYSVFRTADGKRAIVIVNDDARSEILAAVEFEGGPSGPCVIVSPDHPDERPVVGPILIGPESAVVVLER